MDNKEIITKEIPLLEKYDEHGPFPVYISMGGAKERFYYFILMDYVNIGYGGKKDRIVRYILKEYMEVGEHVDYKSFFVSGTLKEDKHGRFGWEIIPVNLCKSDTDQEFQKIFLKCPKNEVVKYFAAIFTQIDMERHPELYRDAPAIG